MSVFAEIMMSVFAAGWPEIPEIGFPASFCIYIIKGVVVFICFHVF